MRSTEASWDVISHPFKEGKGDEVLATYGQGETAERHAKEYALELVDRAWERDD